MNGEQLVLIVFLVWWVVLAYSLISIHSLVVWVVLAYPAIPIHILAVWVVLAYHPLSLHCFRAWWAVMAYSPLAQQFLLPPLKQSLCHAWPTLGDYTLRVVAGQHCTLRKMDASN